MFMYIYACICLCSEYKFEKFRDVLVVYVLTSCGKRGNIVMTVEELNIEEKKRDVPKS